MGTVSFEPRSFADPKVHTGPINDDLRLSGLAEGGRVTLISLAAVRTRLGPGWDQRRDRIWEAVARHLERRLQPGDRYERVSDVELMLAVGRTREEAIALSVNILKELLIFFLGEPHLPDLRIEQVAAVRDGRIIWARVDLRTFPRSFAAPPDEPRDGVALLTSDGRELRLTFELERIFSVRNALGAGLRVKPILSEAFCDQRLGPDWRETLAFADLLKVDLATLGALEPLRLAMAAHKLIVPLSVRTVFSERGLASVLSHLDDGATNGGEAAASGPLVEICGVDMGTPRARLEEAVSILRRSAKGVIAQTTGSRWQLEPLRDCKLSGLSIDCGTIRDKAKMQAALGSFGKAARTIGPVSLALSLPMIGGQEMAGAAGVSHVSLEAPFGDAGVTTSPDLGLLTSRPPALA